MSMKAFKLLLVGAISMTVMGLASTSLAGGEGEQTFKAKKCADCHATSGPSKIASIEDWEKRKGPDLWYAGSKFNAAWLEKWLASPTPIRGVKWNTLEPNTEKHPALGGKEGHEVTEYLMSLKDKDGAAGAAKQDVSKPRGKILFEKKQACYACHQVKGGSKILGGISGPTFVGAKDRLNPDFVAAYLKNQGKYDPKGRMPNFSYLSDPDVAILAGYIKFLE